MNRYFQIIAIILFPLTLFLQGCAVYMPASEEIIYHDQDEEPYGVKTSFPIPVAGSSISYSAMILSSDIRDEIRRRHRDDLQPGEEISFRSTFLITNFMPGISFPLAYKSALGMNINPFYPGLDGTVHLFGDNWLTSTFQFPAYQGIDFEWILQRPILRVLNGGLSAGLFYRKERVPYHTEAENPRFLDFVPRTFRTDWYGTRLSGSFPDLSDNQSMKFHIHAGYSPDYKAALFMFGIGVTFRPKSRTEFIEPIRYWD